MPHLCTRVLFAVLATALASPAQSPLPFHGLELDLPKGWTTQPSESVLLIVPPGWKQDEETGEAFGLLFDAETKTLAGDEFESAIDGAAEALLEGAQRTGEVQQTRLGTLEGRTFRYSLKNAQGRAVAIRIHVCLAKEGAVALFALGFTDKLAARDKELTAMLGSLRPAGQKPKRRAFGMGGNPPPAGEEPAPTAQPAEAPPKEPAAERTAEAAPAKAGPRLPGGTPTNWKGMTFDLPKGWTTKSGDGGALGVLPPDFGKSGILDEIYVLLGDGSVRSLDVPDLAEKVQEGLDELQPGLLPDGEPKATKFGSLKGMVFTFRGPSGQGQDVLARVYAFPTAGGVCALVGLGFPDKLGAREAEVLAMLSTLRAAKAGAAGGTAPELVGQWVYFSNFNAVNGGGRMTSTTLTLNADGTFRYESETSTTNPLGGAVSQEDTAGRWSLRGDTLSFQSSSGEQTSYRLEKRNHPKTNDPMILLDGKAFVTATQRAPW